MGIKLSAREKRELNAQGAIVTEMPGLASQPKATYYDRYGDPHANLPADAWSMQHYQKRGFSLQKPRKPAKRPPQVGVADWDGVSKEGIADEQAAIIAAMPKATYYTAQGTALELPADPESMAKYLASGLSLDPPSGSSPATTGGPSEEPTPIRRRRA